MGNDSKPTKPVKPTINQTPGRLVESSVKPITSNIRGNNTKPTKPPRSK